MIDVGRKQLDLKVSAFQFFNALRLLHLIEEVLINAQRRIFTCLLQRDGHDGNGGHPGLHPIEEQ